MSLRAESATAEFWVILGTELCRISMSAADARILDAFKYLKVEYADIVGRVSYKQCKYYRLKNPVPLPENVDEASIVEECSNESNLEAVSSSSALKVLAPVLLRRHVYLVIKLPEGAPQEYTC